MLLSLISQRLSRSVCMYKVHDGLIRWSHHHLQALCLPYHPPRHEAVINSEINDEVNLRFHLFRDKSVTVAIIMTSIPFLVIIMMALLLVYCIESYTVNSWKSSISGIGSCKKHRLQAKPDLFAGNVTLLYNIWITFTFTFNT